MRQVMPARRPQLADLGLFLLVVALPLVFTPFSASPFGDPKLIVLVAGCLCLVASGLAADRLTAYAGCALVAVTVMAAAFGVDPLRGLTAQANSGGSGLITIVCVVVVASVGAAMPEDLRRRAMRWFVAAGVVVAVAGIAYRLAPGVFEGPLPGGGLSGSTLGNRVFAAAFVAAAIGALLVAQPTSETSTRWWSALVVMSLGVASFDQRSSLILPVAAGLVALWRVPGSRARVNRGVIVVASMLIVWQLVDPLLPSPGRLDQQLSSLTSERARLAMAEVGVRSTAERPLLGWGPGSVRSAHIATASPTELAISGRGVGDAHNLFVNTMIELGVVGLAAMLFLVGLLAKRALPRAPDNAMAFVAATVMALYAMIEPISLVLTPLLFLFLAMAGPVSGDLLGARWRSHAAGRVARTAVGLSLAVAMLVSLQMLGASALERWGRRYGEIWAFDDALRVQPWRISAAQQLSVLLAVDARSGDVDAGERARAVIADAVADHPWDADVRLTAADVETLLRDDEAAAAWIREHLERFPSDAQAVREAEESP
jgi:hypothetical protein